jgi:3-hydroxy-9,10-secoandrosta-1,3,5(10)-triene-9,17-dione monooxygenase reductase component
MKSPYIDGSVVDGVVGLLTVESQGVRNAMTVSCFSELAHHPTALWVSVANDSHTHALLTAGGTFSLSLLGADQGHVARACGEVSGRERDKCAGLALYAPQPGSWFLRGALTCTACRVYDTIPVGDHTIFLGEILFGEFDSRRKFRRHLLIADLASA